MNQELETVLNQYIRPILHSHGGDVEILDFTDGIVRFHLLGRCSGCPSADITSEDIIQTQLKAHHPEVKQAVLVREVNNDLLLQAKAIMEARHGKNCKIGLRYCGGCNPWYDRKILRQHLEQKSGCRFTIAKSTSNYDIIYVLCGCASKCCDISDLHANMIVMVDHWPDDAEINSYVYHILVGASPTCF